MDELGLTPSDFQSAQDIAKLPLLTKEQVVNNPKLFVSTAIDTSRCVTLKSSGTTGLHAGILYDPQSMLFLMACAGRELEAITRSLGKPLIQLRVATTFRPYGPFDHLHRFYRAKTALPMRELRLSMLDPIEYNLSLTNRFKPHVLTGYGSYLGLLFQQVLERKVTMHRPEALVYFGSHFPEHVRLLVEGELGIPVFSCYGAVEAHRIGFTCEERNGLHLHMDLCHVSIVGNQEPQGEIVVSNLANMAMVLLNYRLGDIVSLSDRVCPCGRSYPLLDGLVGRSDEVIHLPDGRYIIPGEVYKVFRARKDVLDYQVIQEEQEGFVVKVVPYKVSDFRQTEEDLLVAFGSLFGRTARVTVEPVDVIPPLPNGKVRRVCALGSAGPTPAEP
jgi:phenylacetate-CoA ligase